MLYKYLKIVILTISLFFSTQNLTAKSQLSANAKVSLLTCGPGKQAYSAFGHSAIHIRDFSQNIDLIFNYGTFDFNTPYFYLKFASGKLNYMLSIVQFRDFITFYKGENRSIYSQELNLSLTQKNQLLDKLIENYQPENRFYQYDFFIKNCATRIDDIIKETLNCKWETTNTPPTIPYTYRTAMNQYLQNDKWSKFGINLLLGAPSDRTPKEFFLPEILQNNYKHITYNGQKISSNNKTLFLAKKETQNNWIPSPTTAFYTLALILLILSIFYNNHLRYIDFLLFLSIGIIGVIIAYFSFFAEYMATKENWHLLWAIPTHLIIAFFIFFRKTTLPIIRTYFMISLIATITALILGIFPHFFHTNKLISHDIYSSPLPPILLCIIIRSLGIINKKITKSTQY